MLEEVGDYADLQKRDRTAVKPLDRISALALAGGYGIFAAACATQAAIPGWRTSLLCVALVAAYVLGRRTEFVAPTGSTVPTEPVLVALLFTAPLPLVPVLVLAGLLAGGGMRNGPGGTAQQVAVRVASAWHCAGPVLVLWASGLRWPALDHWPVLLLALLAQFMVDAAVALARCAALGFSPRRVTEPLLFTFGVDALLAPLAVSAVLACRGSFAVVVFVLGPIALLRILAIDRNHQVTTAVTLGEALKSVRDEARCDPMTGLANRRAWDEALAAAEQRAAALPGPASTVTVVMADLDYLKAVNDSFGHPAGDEMLQSFAAVLVEHAPEGAVAARIGGDEFGLLLEVPAGGELDAASLVSHLRSAMLRRRVSCGETVSASIGVASCPPAASVAEAVRLADAAAAADKQERRAQRAPEVSLRLPVAGPDGGPKVTGGNLMSS